MAVGCLAADYSAADYLAGQLAEAESNPNFHCSLADLVDLNSYCRLAHLDNEMQIIQFLCFTLQM